MELDQRSLDLAASRKRALEAERLLAEKDEATLSTPFLQAFRGFSAAQGAILALRRAVM